MKSGYLSAVATAGGGIVRAPQAAAIRAIPTASALIRINSILLRRGGRQTLDEPPGHIGLDDNLAVRSDVAHDAGDAVQARDLLPIEVRPAVEGNRNAARIERKLGRHHLQQLGEALARSCRDQRGARVGGLQT